MSAEERDRLPLTSPQAGIWVAQQLNPESCDYHIAEYLEIRGAVDAGLFQEALRIMIDETECLQVRFVEEDGQVWQVPHRTAPLELDVVDVSDHPDPRAGAEEHMRAMLARPIDLARDPLDRHLLFRAGPERYFWLHAPHHIVVDGVTGAMMIRRVAEAYTALVNGTPLAPATGAPLRQIVTEDRDYRSSEQFAQDRAYWLERMTGLPETVSFGGRTGVTPSGRVLRRRTDLGPETAQALRALARRTRTRWTVVVLAAAAAYLHRVSGAEDLVLGLPVTGRTTPAARAAHGVFSNILPLRLTVTSATTVEDLVRQTSQAVREGLRHQRYPVDDLKRDLALGESGRRLWDAAVNVMAFDYDVTFAGLPATAHNLSVGPVDYLSTNVYERGDGTIGLQFEVDAARCDLDELAAHQSRIADFVATVARAAEDTTVGGLDILSPADLRVLLEYGDGGTAPVAAGRGLHQLFEEQARRTPEAVAVVCDGEQVTYRELEERSEEVARRLRPLTGPDRPVGVCVDRSPGMVTAVLAVLKAGGCYVPLDPGLPPRRLEYIVQDAAIDTVVSRPELADRLPAAVRTVVPVEPPARRGPSAQEEAGTPAPASAPAPDPAAAADVSPARAAYMLYTSGSTGQPKGVVVSHGAAVGFTLQNLAACRVGPESRFLGFAALTFDVSVLEIFGALLSGGTLVLATDEERLDIDRLQDLMATQAVTVADLPTALMPLLDPSALPALTFVSTGGEAPSGDVVDRWAAPGREVWNTYGPTETTVVVAMHRCTAPSGGTAPPIGRPTVNHRLYVVDAQLRLVPPGVPGELCVSGDGLARGYLGRSGLTAGRFVPAPWSDTPGTRMYRTGDLVRWNDRGELEFLGRIDQQVKINGHRIELGEIETELIRHPAVAQAAVLVQELPAGGRRLVAHVVGAAGPQPVPAALRSHLAEALPHYMVPHSYVVRASLPLTTSGKLDRKALAAELAVPPESPKPPEPAAGTSLPSFGTEAVLCGLFAQVLGREKVGAQEGFFELGGDSITALTLVSRARAAGLTMTLRDVFTHRTPAALARDAAETAALDTEAAAADPAPQTAAADPDVPLTPIMRWLLDTPGPVDRFSQSVLVQTPADTDQDRLTAVLQALLDHHDMLRLRTETAEGAEPACRIQPRPAPVHLTRVDLTGLDEEARRAAVARETEAAPGRLDPAAGTVTQAIWFDFGRDRPGRLLLCLHHLVVDGVSWRVLLADLAEAWAAVSAGRPVQLQPVETPFPTWAKHLGALALDSSTTGQLPLWRGILSPADPVPAPLTDRVPDPARDTAATTRTLTVTLPAEVVQPLLTTTGAALRTGPDGLMLAALALAAHRGQQRSGSRAAAMASLLVDLEGHGRDAHPAGGPDLSRTVGWFTTQYPARIDLRGLDLTAAWRGGPALADLARRVRDDLAALPNGAGYGLLRHLHPTARTELAGLPQPPILFNYLGRFPAADEGPWKPAPESSALGADTPPEMPAEHCLQIDVLVRGRSGSDELTARFTWPRALLSETEATGLADDWAQALRLLAAWSDEAGAHRLTPADCPLVQLDRIRLDRLADTHPGLAEVLPLSPLQEGLFFHASYDEQTVDAYTGQLILDLRGPLDLPALKESLRTLLRRHDALRAGFTDHGLTEPVQIVLAEVDAPLDVTDLSGLGDGARQEALTRLLDEDRLRRFDLARPPLVRFTLVRLGESEHRLVMTNHHILWDGWSAAVLLKELLAGYAACAGHTPWTPEPAEPFRSYLAWHARQDRAAAAAAWQRALDGPAVPTLLAGTELHRVATLPERIPVELDADLTARLTARARSAGVTLSSVVQGSWAILLSRFTGRDDVVFGGTVSGRTPDLPGIEHMVGLLINTLPVRFRIREDEPLVEALARFQDEQTPLLDHQHLGLADIQHQAGLGTLFDTAVAFENYPVDEESLSGAAAGLRLAGVEGTDATHYTVNLVVLPGERLCLNLDHRPDVLDPSLAHGMADVLRRLLTAVAEQPDLPVGAVELMSAEERHRVLREWNDTARPVPEGTLADLFERRAARDPHRTATVFEEETLTYRELDARADRLAARLRARGAGPEGIVAVALHRSTEMVVALLAVLKSGAAYLPVDPGLPADRVAYLLADAAPALLITESATAAALPDEPAVPRMLLDETADTADGADGADPGAAAATAAEPARPTGSDPAYVIYTSGSTGRPKGVVVTHDAIVNRLAWMQDAYRLDDSDRVLQKTPFGFDVSVWEFFWPLLEGATLVVARPDGHKDPAYLARTIQEQRITTVHFVPSMLAAFLEEPTAAGCRSLRRVVCSGEALSEQTQNRFHEVLDVPLHNLYGPTEAAVDVTFWECRPGPGPVPIGRPIWNTRLYVLDAELRPVPVGVVGELYLAGAGLARGYLGRPALTAERFLPDPFGPAGARMYRTGDLARWRADGVVEYLGRTDDQVKIHGFRIELGEIDAVLARVSGVARSAVIVREDAPGERRLVGYVVPEPGVACDPEVVRRALAATLPEYMVPALVVVDDLPLTPNGKLDRRALPAPSAPAAEYVPPATETEELVAGLWAEILGAPLIGRHDNFFDLGGHSLRATRVMARLRHSLGLDLPLHTLFDRPTVAALADAVETALLEELLRTGSERTHTHQGGIA
ncbi:amino acid adenylation domain-containing protein [Streptomyces roseirectus]|uniref:Amino acid adenylation domain-containing protein n=1 Tax=Streptomyces roseirectus TaxID=2768066 RepID=A0A7H0IQ20_9ACTN|nr:non-ribosomal peptide synthetase [Streptomyces roseirectus]QNP74886.1 amino acid adenylation domain-containing protein [Streptomyces roseirectus]